MEEEEKLREIAIPHQMPRKSFSTFDKYCSDEKRAKTREQRSYRKLLILIQQKESNLIQES